MVYGGLSGKHRSSSGRSPVNNDDDNNEKTHTVSYMAIREMFLSAWMSCPFVVCVCFVKLPRYFCYFALLITLCYQPTCLL